MLEGIAQQIAEKHEEDFAVGFDGGFGWDGENGFEAAVGEEDLLFGKGFAYEFHEPLRAAFSAAAFLAGLAFIWGIGQAAGFPSRGAPAGDCDWHNASGCRRAGA